MVGFTRATLGKVMSGVMVMGLVAGGALAASALNAGAANPAIVDHFLCYAATSPPTAAAPGFKVPAGLRLIDQFAPNGFLPKVGAVDLHCNPAQKTVLTSVTRVTNPSAHLLCWGISATTAQPAETVVVTNQFGKATLKVSAPNQLCLPTWKSLTGPPATKTPAPPALSHFTCYPVALLPGTAGFQPPSSVTVRDQFSPKPVPVKVGAPLLLCLPTTKILPTGASFRSVNDRTHLLCFAVSPTPKKTPVFDKNQFGQGKVNVLKTRLLCLPSTKVVVGPNG